MKRIVHITSVHPTFDIRIFVKECRSLAESGYDVHLVAPHTKDEVVDGVHVWGIRRLQNRWQRLFLASWNAYRRAKSLDADLYHFHDPELMPWGLLLQMRRKVPVVYDSHEYLARDIRDKEYLPPWILGPLSYFADAVEKFFARRLAGIVAVNPHMADLFRPMNPNVAAVANFPRREMAEKEIERHPEPDTVLYLGLMGRQRGLETVIQAMEIVRRTKPHAVCRILGEIEQLGLSAETAALSPEDLAARGIEVIAKVPHSDVQNIASRHAVGWVPWLTSPAYEVGTPTKLLEYMAFGLPVVASNLMFTKKIVEDSDCGIVVPWDSPQEHARALLELWNDTDRAARLGANGRRAVLEKLNWERQTPELAGLYERLFAQWNGRSMKPIGTGN